MRNCCKKTKATSNRLFCQTCGHILYEDIKLPASIKIPGYNSEGYNEGLGVYIKDKKHYDQVCKETGSIPVG